MLAFDKTTLSRNLKLLERKGWIALAPSADRRRRTFAVTSEGKRRLKIAAPHWQKAQLQVRSRLKNREWNAAWKALAALTEVSHDSTHGKSSPS
jgi:DNA-binding MarR family transcriptional regulator